MHDERPTPLDARLRDFERALIDRPDDVETLSAYGEASLLRGRLLEAMRSFQHLVALHPESVQFQLALGKVYLDSGLVAEALRVVEQVLDGAPTSVEGHLLLRRLSKVNGSVSGDVIQRLSPGDDFLPPVEALAEERVRLEAAISQVDAEIGELSDVAEPVAEFSTLLARARRERQQEMLGELERWEDRHRQIEEERRRVEDEERRRLEDEERFRREQEEAERRRIEDEERLRREHEEAERHRLEEEERVRREREEAERQRLEEEERVRREEADAERRRLEEEERARREQEDEERRQREAEEAEAQRGTREREEAYARLAPALSTTVSAFMKTKGVSTVLVMARDGFLVHESHVQDVDVKTFSTFVVDACHALATPGDALGRWKVWVLEFPKGILVLHKITPDYFLVVYGQTGANFGLLTLLIDKNKGQLEGVLGEAPAVP